MNNLKVCAHHAQFEGVNFCSCENEPILRVNGILLVPLDIVYDYDFQTIQGTLCTQQPCRMSSINKD